MQKEDPSQYAEVMKQLQQQLGGGVPGGGPPEEAIDIEPEPAFVIKTRRAPTRHSGSSLSLPTGPEGLAEGGALREPQKFFVNVCTHDHIPEFSRHTSIGADGQEQEGIRVPVSVAHALQDAKDKAGRPCAACDVVVSPSVVAECAADPTGQFRHFVCQFLLQAVEKKHAAGGAAHQGGSVSAWRLETDYRLPKLQYQGTIPPASHRVRKRTAPKVQVQPVEGGDRETGGGRRGGRRGQSGGGKATGRQSKGDAGKGGRVAFENARLVAEAEARVAMAGGGSMLGGDGRLRVRAMGEEEEEGRRLDGLKQVGRGGVTNGEMQGEGAGAAAAAYDPELGAGASAAADLLRSTESSETPTGESTGPKVQEVPPESMGGVTSAGRGTGTIREGRAGSVGSDGMHKGGKGNGNSKGKGNGKGMVGRGFLRARRSKPVQRPRAPPAAIRSRISMFALPAPPPSGGDARGGQGLEALQCAARGMLDAIASDPQGPNSQVHRTAGLDPRDVWRATGCTRAGWDREAWAGLPADWAALAGLRELQHGWVRQIRMGVTSARRGGDGGGAGRGAASSELRSVLDGARTFVKRWRDGGIGIGVLGVDVACALDRSQAQCDEWLGKAGLAGAMQAAGRQGAVPADVVSALSDGVTSEEGSARVCLLSVEDGGGQSRQKDGAASGLDASPLAPPSLARANAAAKEAGAREPSLRVNLSEEALGIQAPGHRAAEEVLPCCVCPGGVTSDGALQMRGHLDLTLAPHVGVRVRLLSEAGARGLAVLLAVDAGESIMGPESPGAEQRDGKGEDKAEGEAGHEGKGGGEGELPSRALAALGLACSLVELAGGDRAGAVIPAPDTSSAKPGTLFYRPGPDSGSKQERVRAAFRAAGGRGDREDGASGNEMEGEGRDDGSVDGVESIGAADRGAAPPDDAIDEHTVLPEDAFHQRDPYSMHLLRQREEGREKKKKERMEKEDRERKRVAALAAGGAGAAAGGAAAAAGEHVSGASATAASSAAQVEPGRVGTKDPSQTADLRLEAVDGLDLL